MLLGKQLLGHRAPVMAENARSSRLLLSRHEGIEQVGKGCRRAARRVMAAVGAIAGCRQALVFIRGSCNNLLSQGRVRRV